MGKFSRKKKKNNRGGSALAAIVALLLLAAVLGGAWFFLMGPGKTMGKLPDISAGSISLNGMNKEEATEALRELAAKYETYNMVISVGEESVELTPGESGAKLDVDGIVADIFDQSGSADALEFSKYLTLDEDAIQNAVSDLAARTDRELVQTSYYVEGDDPAEGQTMYITYGQSGISLNEDALYDAVLNAYYSTEFSAEGSCEVTEPEYLDFAAILEEYYVAPVDAVMDPDTGEVTEGKSGYGFDMEELNGLFNAISYGETVSLSIHEIPPEVTEEDIWASLYQDVLATCTTPHTADEDRNANLQLACDAINGMILQPGDVFSYNDALGPRTPENGYRLGDSYENGRVVQSYGGGICQVTSTLYYCTLIADLDIYERHCHMFAPDYIELGMDATVAWGALDFRFCNNTGYPIRISAYMEDGYVTVTLRGTDTKDYYVDMTYEILDVYDYDTEYEYYSADNEEGYYDGQAIITPAIGYGVDTYRCKYDKQTNELISEEYEDYSDYDHRDALICKIIEETEEESEEDSGYSEDNYYVGSGGGISPDGG